MFETRMKAKNGKIQFEFFDENGTACFGKNKIQFGISVSENCEPTGGNRSYTYNVAFANWTENSGIYARVLNDDKMLFSSVQHLPIYKFDTVAELDSFKTAFYDILTMDSGLDETPSFDYITAAYNDSFL